MRALATLLTSFALALAAAPALPQDKGAQDNLAWIAGDDPDMANAVRTARAGLGTFFQRWTAPAKDEKDFSVKFNLAPKGDAEFIWAIDLRREGSKLTGVLSDEPLTAGYRTGQRVAIPESDIIDWAYFKAGVAQGHITTKVLLKQLPRDQAAGVRRALGWAAD